MIGGHLRRFSVVPALLAVVLCLMLGSCRQSETSPALPVDEDAPVTTDAISYTPNPEEYGYVSYAIGYSYTNAGDTSIYLQPCNVVPPPPYFYLEHYDGATWGDNYAPFCRGGGPGVDLPATEVRPGETVAGTVTVFASSVPDSYPFIGKDFIVGTTRLVFGITDSMTGDSLPLEERVSNAFWLEAP